MSRDKVTMTIDVDAATYDLVTRYANEHAFVSPEQVAADLLVAALVGCTEAEHGAALAGQLLTRAELDRLAYVALEGERNKLAAELAELQAAREAAELARTQAEAQHIGGTLLGLVADDAPGGGSGAALQRAAEEGASTLPTEQGKQERVAEITEALRRAEEEGRGQDKAG